MVLSLSDTSVPVRTAPTFAAPRVLQVGPTPEIAKPVLPLWGALLMAAASGPILASGFPFLSWWPLTFVGVGLILVSLIGRRPRAAFLVGFVAGVCFYLIHISWTSLFLGPEPETALAVLESLFWAAGTTLIAVAYRWIPATWNSRLARLGFVPIVISGLWTCREAISSTWPYGGFSWGRVAFSQSQSPFSPLFSWIGVSGVTFVIVFLVALAIEAWRAHDLGWLGRLTLVVATAAIVVLVPAYPVVEHGTTTVAAVQGDGRAGYFQRAPYGTLLSAQYKESMTLYGSKKKIDMVIWPEGGSDIDPLESDVAAEVFSQVAKNTGAPLLGWAVTHRGSKYFNTSLLWEYGKGVVDYYDKKHPVPFGEYVPDRSFWEPLAPSLIGLIGRDYTPGTTNTIFNVNGVIAGIDICFDITDDTVMRDSIHSGAQILIAQTNNADFGHTDESVQQLEIARIRAMELGRTLVNVSTVGTSAIILPSGKTVEQLPTYKPGTMVQTVPLSTTITPASWDGEGLEQFVSAVGGGGMIVAVALGKKRNKKRRTPEGARR